MRTRRSPLSPRSHDSSALAHPWFVRGWRRRALCLVLIFGLLIVPDVGYAVRAASEVAAKVAKDSLAPLPVAARWVKRLFRRTTPPPRQDTLADRLAYVSRIQITPLKFVGYEGQSLGFTALALNFNGDLIQGVRFDWQSSNPDKVQIDDSGRATFLQPGLARLTCRAGAVSVSAPVLVRPGSRPPQTDLEWRLDQNLLRLDGTVQIGQNDSGGMGGLATMLDRLAPTAYAQGGTSYSNSDFPYDELWSEPRNLVGSPPHRAIEATRIGAVMPESNNFAMAIPLIDLSGRGLSAGLTLSYNSRVWFRHGSAITFDAVESRPSPGFSLGFGRLLTYGSSNALKYLWVSADGTRHYLGQGGSAAQSVTLQTNDGTRLTFVGTAAYGGTLYSNDGSKINISVINNRLLPWSISDRNGNYISIAYRQTACDPNCSPCSSCSPLYPTLMLDYITDTLGRVIQCNYDASNNLVSITAPGFGGTAQQPVTQTIAQFDYESRTVSNNFSGLTVENRPTQAMNFLKHVYLPATQTGCTFTYSAFGTIYNVSRRRQMSINQSGVISDGLESNSVAFNYQTASTPALTDAPSFTQRTENAANAPQSVYAYGRWDGQGYSVFIITQPDGTRQTIARNDPATAVSGGLLYYVQPQKADGTPMRTIYFFYATDGGGSPQVGWTYDYDETNTPTAVTFDYDQYGNVTNQREWGYPLNGQWVVRRRTRSVYKTDTSYINAYLRSLVVESDVYDSQANDTVPIAKTTFTYDDYQAMGGMDEHRDAQGNLPPPPPGHFGNYDASYTTRGNVTGTTKYYDIANNLSYIWLRKIDVFGNVTQEQLSCCNQQTVTDTQNTYWAMPESVTKGTSGGPQLTSTAQYDFNTSRPTSMANPAGLMTLPTYDAVGRVTATSIRDVSGNLLPGPTATYGDGSLTVTRSFIYDDNGTQKTLTSTTTVDGWGRTIQTVNPSQSQVNTTYNNMGRVASVSNPFAAGGSPSYSTSYSYDALGRQTTVTLPDNQAVQTTYSSNSVIVTDQVNRKMQRLTDGLGRLVTVYEQDASGNLTQATNYSYDILDNLTQVNQGGQLRAFKYDAMGRLVYEKIPEQTPTISDGLNTWTTKYTYTDFSKVASRRDARGVITSYSYDTLHRLAQTTYDTSGAQNVALTDAVLTSYNADGTLNGTSVGTAYSDTYSYDSFKRLASVTKYIAGSVVDTRKTYSFSYSYNGASQPLSLTYPSGTQAAISYDAYGRPSSVGSVSNISYNVAGQVTADTLINGITEQFDYDPQRLQMSSQKAGTASPYTNRMNLTYSYSAAAGQMGVGTTAGNASQLMGIVPDVNTNPSTINGTTESAAYTYDNYGRLVTGNQTSNGSSAQRRFVYDRFGNRTAVYDSTSGGNQIQSITLVTNGSAPTNQISSVTTTGTVNYIYDAAGNVINDGLHSYTYDAENRLVSVDSGAALYRYDSENHRVCKVVGASWTHYVWQGNQVLGEHDGTTAYGNFGDPPYGLRSAKVDYLYLGSRQVASYQWTHTTTCSKGICTTTHTAQAQYYLSDRLSMRLVLDASGNVVGRQAHLPFGEDFAESGTQQKQHFTSYERDSESSTDYAVNRYYGPALGRFTSVDPFKGSIAKPQRANRYAYVLNDPINKKDILGLDDGDDDSKDDPVTVPPDLIESIIGCVPIYLDGVIVGFIGNCGVPSNEAGTGQKKKEKWSKEKCEQALDKLDDALAKVDDSIKAISTVLKTYTPDIATVLKNADNYWSNHYYDDWMLARQVFTNIGQSLRNRYTGDSQLIDVFNTQIKGSAATGILQHNEAAKFLGMIDEHCELKELRDRVRLNRAVSDWDHQVLYEDFFAAALGIP
jgi:RHS repeat-associated protein